MLTFCQQQKTFFEAAASFKVLFIFFFLRIVLSSGQTITTCRNIVERNMLRAFGQRVAMCCDMLGVVGSNLTVFKFEPTTPNMLQHGGQTDATCCTQQCCDILRWHVAIVWPGL